MQEHPQTTLEFNKWFASEDACREYLARLRWPEGFRCPRCGGSEAWRMRRGLSRCRSCDCQTSVTAGTIFQDTRKPLRLWFRGMWALAHQRQAPSALGLQRMLKLGSYRTAWTWMHKLRRTMVRPGCDRLTGTVEVDEASLGFGGPGDREGGAAWHSLILVAAQQACLPVAGMPEGRDIARIRLRRLPDALGPTLTAAILEVVAPGTLVWTDGWTGYEGLAALGYAHEVVREESHVGTHLLPSVNRVVALLRGWLLERHRGTMRPPYLDYYLDEFTFRFNHRASDSPGELFYRLVRQAVAVQPVPARLIRKCRAKP